MYRQGSLIYRTVRGTPSRERTTDETGREHPQLRSRRLAGFAAGLGAEYVVLDTYRGRPEDYRPAQENWRMLETVAARSLQGG